VETSLPDRLSTQFIPVRLDSLFFFVKRKRKKTERKMGEREEGVGERGKWQPFDELCVDI